jgi:thioesterase domain-containing protein
MIPVVVPHNNKHIPILNGYKKVSNDTPEITDTKSMTDNTAYLQTYLNEHIPITNALGVNVEKADLDSIVLSAPLAPNINHRETVFGGSASAVAILSAWALVNLRLRNEGLQCRLVIQRNSMDYEKPIDDTFTATGTLLDVKTWDRFIAILKKKTRARIQVQSVLHCHGERVGYLTGDFVAFGIKTGTS